ncbi:MAG TPA: tetratricopeptide repeat protein [Bacteroidales bacterium]
MKTKYFLVLCAVLFAVAGYAQKEKKYVREGNKQYEEGNFSEAEVQYRKALSEDPKSYKGKFNLGDAMYEQKNFDESGKLFNELAESNASNEVKSGANYNMGNSFMSSGKYKEAIEAYKQALRQNPDDLDAKYNLEYARIKLKEQQQQEQNQNQDQNKDQDKKDENKDQQDKKDDQNQDQNQKDDQQQQDQNKGDQNKDQQKQEQQPQQISKEDAQRMMEALKNDEKQTLQKLQEQKAKAVKAKSSDIDW